MEARKPCLRSLIGRRPSCGCCAMNLDWWAVSMVAASVNAALALMHLNGVPVRSCLTPVGSLGNAEVTSIEGLAQNGELTAVQQAWIEADVPQCGYCQAGHIMAASALLEQTNSPSDEQIDAALSGNLCRCGTYLRIRAAIKAAGRQLASADAQRSGELA